MRKSDRSFPPSTAAPLSYLTTYVSYFFLEEVELEWGAASLKVASLARLLPLRIGEFTMVNWSPKVMVRYGSVN